MRVRLAPRPRREHEGRDGSLERLAGQRGVALHRPLPHGLPRAHGDGPSRAWGGHLVWHRRPTCGVVRDAIEHPPGGL